MCLCTSPTKVSFGRSSLVYFVIINYRNSFRVSFFFKTGDTFCLTLDSVFSKALQGQLQIFDMTTEILEEFYSKYLREK